MNAAAVLSTFVLECMGVTYRRVCMHVFVIFRRGDACVYLLFSVIYFGEHVLVISVAYVDLVFI